MGPAIKFYLRDVGWATRRDANMPRWRPVIADRPKAASSAGLRRWQIALAAGALLLGCAPATATGFLNWVLALHHDVQVITATDTTPVGALLRPATPENPVYYVAMSAGYRDLGGLMGGDKLPAPQNMIRTVAKVLAKQGYLPADNQHPPTQCIIFAWGTLYRNLVPNAWNPNMPDEQLNRSAMMRFLGGNKLGLVSDRPDPLFDTEVLPGLTRFNPNAVAIASVAQEDLYAVMLAGYAFPIARPNPPQLLWRTKIGCPARGLVMADTLPTMVTIAGPYIGRETNIPVWVNASDKFKPDIKIGNPKVEEYIDSGESPIYEQKSLAPKATSGGRH